MVIGRVMRFKRAHRGHYWLRMLIAMVWVVHLVMYATLAQAVQYEEFEVGITTTTTTAYSSSPMARNLDNRLFNAYNGPGTSLMVNYTDDNGTTWNETEVVADGWKTATYVKPGALMCSHNNSTILVFRAAGADNANDVYLAYMTNATGDLSARSWTVISVWGGSTSAKKVDADINDTDHVGIVWRYSTTAIWHRIYDFQGLSWDNAASEFVVFANAEPNICSNSTGTLNVAWGPINVGGFWHWSYRDIDKSGATVTVADDWIQTTETIKAFEFICLNVTSGDRHAVIWVTLSDKVILLCQDGQGSTTSFRRYIEQSANTLRRDYVGVAFDDSENLMVAWYDLDDDKVYGHNGAWDQTQGAWDGEALLTLLTVSVSADLVYVHAGSMRQYPMHEGVSASIPESGWYLGWVHKRTAPAPDVTDRTAAWADGTTWPEFDWTPPAPPVTPPTNVTSTTYWWNWWNPDGGTCLITLVILFMVAVMAITIARSSGRW